MADDWQFPSPTIAHGNCRWIAFQLPDGFNTGSLRDTSQLRSCRYLCMGRLVPCKTHQEGSQWTR